MQRKQVTGRRSAKAVSCEDCFFRRNLLARMRAGEERFPGIVGFDQTVLPHVERALLADEAPEHRRYRIDPESLTPAAVYRFCESADESTRALGLRLIGRSALSTNMRRRAFQPMSSTAR